MGIESTNDSAMSESRFAYHWFLIRRWCGWIVIRDESKSNRIIMNNIKYNRKSKWIKIRMNCESKWIRIKNKMIRRSESQIKKKILIQLANQNFSLIFDSIWRIKMNRFGPSPTLNLLIFDCNPYYKVDY